MFHPLPHIEKEKNFLEVEIVNPKSPASQSPYRVDMLLHLNGGLTVNTSGLGLFSLFLVSDRWHYTRVRSDRIATMSGGDM